MVQNSVVRCYQNNNDLSVSISPKNFLFTPATCFCIFHQTIIRHVPDYSYIKKTEHVARYTLEVAV
jgi:hypothetical protein